MAEAVATVAFWQAGFKVRVGDVIDTSSDLYILFPSRFTIRSGADIVTVGTLGTAAGTLGSLIGRRPVFDSNGTAVGFVGIYDAITG